MAPTPTLRFCPLCATPLEPLDERPYRRRCPACGWRYWGNPRPTATALVSRAGARGPELLLVRRAREPHKGLWDIPGGFIEWEEEAEAALRRELREEAHIEVGALALHGVWRDEYEEEGRVECALNIVFSAPLASPHGGVAGDDADSLAWFAADALPPLAEIAFDSGKGAVARWLEAQRATHAPSV